MFRLGPWEIALIVVIVLVIFGPRRLPELGKGIGQFIKNFKKGIQTGGEEKSSEKEDKKDETDS